MRRMSDSEFDAHNDRVGREAAERERYIDSLQPEQMIDEISIDPSPEKLDTFNQAFREMMDAQMTLHGADSVAEKWAQMQAAYDEATGQA